MPSVVVCNRHVSDRTTSKTTQAELDAQEFDRIAELMRQETLDAGGEELPEDDGSVMSVVFMPPPRKPAAK